MKPSCYNFHLEPNAMGILGEERRVHIKEGLEKLVLSINGCDKRNASILSERVLTLVSKYLIFNYTLCSSSLQCFPCMKRKG